MTWDDFKDEVKGLLTVDQGRLGAEDFIEQKLKLGVLDLQSHIEFYTAGHEDTLDAGDFTDNGSASTADLPSGCRVQEAYICRTNADDDEDVTEHPVLLHDWEKRLELINGEVTLLDNNGRMAISPQGVTYLVYPAIKDGVEATDGSGKTYDYTLKLVWNGKKHDFAGDDETPFDLEEAEAVALYVKSYIAKDFEKDLAMSQSLLADYLKKRQKLYLDAQARVSIT